MLVSLTVGKVDAGVAVLLTADKRLIEFPSILLPPDIHSGSIVDINVARNQHAERLADDHFNTLQSTIFSTFGTRSPTAPVLRCRNATQTSVVLEWDPIDLATAELRSLSLYRNGAKAGTIPLGKLSTKISGLALDTDYTFHLILRTSAGQYSSERLTVKTHKMTDLHGVTITPGIMPPQLKESLAETVHRIGAKLIEGVRIDTTHFVCTEPRGQGWEKAVELNVPVVVPDWVKGCEREGRVVGVRAYYLDADPSKRMIGPSASQQSQEGGLGGGQGGGGGAGVQRVNTEQARSSPRIEHTPPTPEQVRPERELPLREPVQAPIATTIISTGGGGGSMAEKPDEDGEEEDEEEAEPEKSKPSESKAPQAVDADESDEEEEDGDENGEHDGPEMTSVSEAAEAAMEDGKFDDVAL